MPTENRSSNTALVSMRRELLQRIDHMYTNGMSIFGECEEVRAILDSPTPWPHPEPIAWKVGTDSWWTKEEAEKDAAATGLPMIPFGALTGSAEAEQLRAVIKHSDAQIMRISNQRAHLAERAVLLRAIADHCNGCVMPTEQLLRDWGSSIDAALSASPEPGATIWACSPCRVEQPTDRPSDVCGGKTELAGTKS